MEKQLYQDELHLLPLGLSKEEIIQRYIYGPGQNSHCIDLDDKILKISKKPRINSGEIRKVINEYTSLIGYFGRFIPETELHFFPYDKHLFEAFKQDFVKGNCIFDMGLDTNVDLGDVSFFVDQTKKMIDGTGYMPDIIGKGNLILDDSGRVNLVDLNNTIPIDPNQNYISPEGILMADLGIRQLLSLERLICRVDPLQSGIYAPFFSEERVSFFKHFNKSNNAWALY